MVSNEKSGCVYTATECNAHVESPSISKESNQLAEWFAPHALALAPVLTVIVEGPQL